jgi:hypothetical protein
MTDQERFAELEAALKPFADAWDDYECRGGTKGMADAEVLLRPDSEFVAASKAMKRVREMPELGANPCRRQM